MNISSMEIICHNNIKDKASIYYDIKNNILHISN